MNELRQISISFWYTVCIDIVIYNYIYIYIQCLIQQSLPEFAAAGFKPNIVPKTTEWTLCDFWVRVLSYCHWHNCTTTGCGLYVSWVSRKAMERSSFQLQLAWTSYLIDLDPLGFQLWFWDSRYLIPLDHHKSLDYGTRIMTDPMLQ